MDIILRASEIPPDLLEFFEPIEMDTRSSVFRVTTKPYSGAHFAVMPPMLVEPCILAGTSEHGCCPSCGAPWRRVVERRDVDQKANEVIKHDGVPGLKAATSHDRVRSLSGATYQYVRGATVGWQPTCDCDTGDPVPCVVLDPFGGSGTTAAVAMELGRDAILCELNPEYVPLAIDRIEATIQWIKDGKPGKKPQKAKVIESDNNQLSLLDGLFDHAGIQGEGDC